MISFCIPLYNFDASNLVTELDRQATLLGLPFEIILIDDFSSKCKDENAQLSKIRSVKYKALDQNLGRARIRNLFLEYAAFDYLLFLDCDSVIISYEFVHNYHAEILEDSQVVCGGRIYPESPVSRDKKLHWKYGVNKESMPADQRNSHPNKSFMTNNFLIKKEILDHIKFDERITSYGHEDTLFGYYLMKNHIQIKHVENPVLHGSLEDNSAFIAKTESGIINLSRMLKHMENEPGFIESVKILKFYERINSKGLLIILRPVFYMICPLIKLLLASGTVSLTLFDIYKLGFLTLHSGKVYQHH
jgi:glycosyltransferase involved in cell wall biosynthesis